MAMNLAKLFSRADDEVIRELIGKTSINILMNIFPEKSSPSKLKEIVFDLYSKEELLLNKKYRNLVFDLLKENELLDLFRAIGEKPTPNPYDKIKTISFARGKEKEAELFNFFELTPPLEVEKIEIPSIDEIEVGYPLFPHQIDAIDRLNLIIHSEYKRAILHMPTGAGKTRTAMNLIAEFLRKNEGALVVWLAYSEELCEQALNEFKKAWFHIGNRKINQYRFWGKFNLEINQIQEGFLVSGLSKMFNALKTSNDFISKLGSKTSLVVMDEAHQAIAESYKLILETLTVYNNSPLIGLTATPGRTYSDIEKDAELAKFFYQKKVTLAIKGYSNPIHYLQSEGYLAKTDFSMLTHNGHFALTQEELSEIRKDFDISEKILSRLGQNELRNIEILKKFKHLVKRHIRIMFFGSSVEHSDMIASLLRAMDIEANSVTGRTSSEERNRIIQDFKSESNSVKVICNYGVLTTGFDAPKTSCVVIARPTKSLVLYSQMVGRAIRGIKQGGNNEAEIVTVIDTSLPGFRDMAEAFMNWEDIF